MSNGSVPRHRSLVLFLVEVGLSPVISARRIVLQRLSSASTACSNAATGEHRASWSTVLGSSGIEQLESRFWWPIAGEVACRPVDGIRAERKDHFLP